MKSGATTPEIQDMMSYYILLRESMKGYMTTVMEEAHEKGTPVMKPLFYDYPADIKLAGKLQYEFLFGHDLTCVLQFFMLVSAHVLCICLRDAGVNMRQVRFMMAAAQFTVDASVLTAFHYS